MYARRACIVCHRVVDVSSFRETHEVVTSSLQICSAYRIDILNGQLYFLCLGFLAAGKHMCAVSTNLDLTSKFGIESDRVFGFWDWVVRETLNPKP